MANAIDRYIDTLVVNLKKMPLDLPWLLREYARQHQVISDDGHFRPAYYRALADALRQRADAIEKQGS